jgi:type II secretory pathway pseudopilin PulG
VTYLRRGSERGVSLLALVVAITIMLVALAVMLPSWEYVIKNEKEEELLFRGYQISDAILRCQAPGKGPASSLEDLVKKRCLRKAYKDPMTKDGKWVIVPPMSQPYAPGGVVPAPTPAPSGMTYMGPMGGVATRSTDKSLRRLNGKEHYNEWRFVTMVGPTGQGQREWIFIGGQARRRPVAQAVGGAPPFGSRPSPAPRP